jgi:peroxiredoxin
MKRLISLLMLAILVLGLVSACQAQAPSSNNSSEGNRVGNLAFDFSLNDLNGQKVTLAALRGQAVMINFWSIDCIYCIEEMPFLQQAYAQEQSKPDGVTILTLNVREGTQRIKQFLQDNSYSLPVLLDVGANVALKYGVSGIPATFFIDSAGVIQYIKRGAFISVAEIQQNLNKIR